MRHLTGGYIGPEDASSQDILIYRKGEVTVCRISTVSKKP